MNPEALAAALLAVIAPLAEARREGSSEGLTAEDLLLERPKNRDHGDWASNAALKLAKVVGANPREFAAEIATGLEAVPGIASVEVAGPGFINIRLDAAAAGALAKTIVEAGASFGTNESQRGNSINVEFVSANPTGPLHIGHTRWAALGDSIARLLLASGATVAREFYVNDAGAQMERFARSVLAAAQGQPTPDDGYGGVYIEELARRVLVAQPDLLELDPADRLVTARELAYGFQLSELQASLENFHVHFDVWFSERLLHAAPADGGPSLVDEAVDRLRAQGHVFDEDGAVWVRTTDFGDDRDRVIRRSNGEYTYFAADAAYYLNKRDRGFAHKIYLLGADHHGYVHRLKSLAGAAGDDPEKDIEVLIGQLVSIKRRRGCPSARETSSRWTTCANGSARMPCAIRWLAIPPIRRSRSIPSCCSKRTNDNPVFYVQYAHARTHNVARNAVASGVERSEFAPELLTHETESALLGALQEFPRIVAFAAEVREPHRVARYLEELAGLYHRWYDNCRVIPLGDEPIEAVHRTRLWLNDATGQVLRNGLDLLGVDAPERM